jgi:hypothetical protein
LPVQKKNTKVRPTRTNTGNKTISADIGILPLARHGPAITATPANDNQSACRYQAFAEPFLGCDDQHPASSVPTTGRGLTGAAMTDAFSVLAGAMSAIGGWVANLDGQFGVLASAMAGAAAAFAVAIIMAIYFRGGHRSSRDMLRHGAAAIVVVGLLAFVASDARHAALDYLGLNSSKPAVEFQLRLPKTTASALANEIWVEHPNHVFAIRHRVT